VQQVRQVAAHIWDREDRRIILEFADDYEKLAADIEREASHAKSTAFKL